MSASKALRVGGINGAFFWMDGDDLKFKAGGFFSITRDDLLAICELAGLAVVDYGLVTEASEWEKRAREEAGVVSDCWRIIRIDEGGDVYAYENENLVLGEMVWGCLAPLRKLEIEPPPFPYDWKTYALYPNAD